jgi:hypothetical protein
MKLNDYFRQFLSNIEPGEKRVSAASASHKAVREYLEGDDQFKDVFAKAFLAGSYARDTAYDPIQDVDIIVVCKWDKEPAKLLSKLKTVLDKHYNYKAKTSPQRRSIRIDLTHISMDIVPARAATGTVAPLEVPDREQKTWVETNPEGHTQWVLDLNKATKLSNTDQGRFKPLAKMLKHWKRYRLPDAKHPKGFWIECLAGWHHDQTARDWADVFIGALERIRTACAAYASLGLVPPLTDPGLQHQTLATGMEPSEFKAFFDALEQALADAKRARDDETGVAESARLWRVVFGPKFPTPEQRAASEALEKARSTTSTGSGIAASVGASLGMRSGRDIRESEPFGSGPVGRGRG